MHAYNLSIQEAEVRRLQVPGQSGLHNETLFQKNKPKQIQQCLSNILFWATDYFGDAFKELIFYIIQILYVILFSSVL
jgi:hypothetical protein